MLAVGLLLADGSLLALAAWWTRKWYLGLIGLILIVMASGVLLYYRRYRRALMEVEQAREALTAELTELRRLAHELKQSS
ncbi:MAG: hypothetical protein ABI679_05125 [Gemmatimonadota bacterium]